MMSTETEDRKEVTRKSSNLQDVEGASEERGKALPQFLAGGTVNIISIVLGTILGWTSPSLRHLEAEDSPIPITTSENSWISSLMPLAAMFGPIAAGYAADKFGRKRSLLFIAFPILVSYALLAAADSVWMLYLGRIIAGLGLGWIFTVMPMYTAEIAEKKYRGALGSLLQFTISIGLVFDYAIGPYVDFMWLSVASLIFPSLFIAGFFFMPETPHYYLQNGQEEEAQKSLMWLRSKSANGVAQELKLLKAEVEEAAQNEGGIKDIISTKSNQKAVGLCLGLLFFQQFTGINLVLFNAETIFAKAGGSVTPDVATIITGLVCLFASLPNPYLVEKFGRRLLLIVSGIGMAASLAVLGLCFYLDENGTDTSSFSFLPIIAVLAFLVFYSPGFGPLPWTVMGEMFPTNIKAVGSTMCASFAWFMGFIVTRFYNDLVEAINDSFTFWVFAIFCAIAAIFVFFLLPETKGKTLSEIHKELS